MIRLILIEAVIAVAVIAASLWSMGRNARAELLARDAVLFVVSGLLFAVRPVLSAKGLGLLGLGALGLVLFFKDWLRRNQPVRRRVTP
ncbi:hypothetical protein [Lacticaseibacillus daqingensis]|uniref:hypothetical protein n=1 Tax=Lacticaseibacillus daqingensis TaxID=2486014 RepID=UPI000F79E75F|nr:hypothetical protein [Lacticaseibacillus daqingensis]